MRIEGGVSTPDVEVNWYLLIAQKFVGDEFMNNYSRFISNYLAFPSSS